MKKDPTLDRRRRRGADSPGWKGGVYLNTNGYRRVSYGPTKRYEHILIAERALGRPMPKGAIVHHVNGKQNNRALVICQDEAYHKLLHKRIAALAACGNPDKRRCFYCRQWDDPSAMLLSDGSSFHRECRNAEARERRRKAKGYRIVAEADAAARRVLRENGRAA